MTTVDSWPKTLPMPSAGSWNSTTETHLTHSGLWKQDQNIFGLPFGILICSIHPILSRIPNTYRILTKLIETNPNSIVALECRTKSIFFTTFTYQYSWILNFLDLLTKIIVRKQKFSIVAFEGRTKISSGFSLGLLSCSPHILTNS